jgi:hypothetical protein
MSELSGNALAVAGEIPARGLDTTAFHQGPPDRPALERPPPGRFEGRYHKREESPPLYCSTGAELVAMLEQARHTVLGDLAETPLPVRSLAKLHLHDLLVVDFSDEANLQALELTRSDLVGNDLRIPQLLGSITRTRAGVHGLVGPSLTHPEALTVVVFPEAIEAHVVVLSERLARLSLEELTDQPPIALGS